MKKLELFIFIVVDIALFAIGRKIFQTQYFWFCILSLMLIALNLFHVWFRENHSRDNEIEELKKKSEDFEKRNIELRGEMQELENKLSDKQTEINAVNSEKALAEKRTKEVEKENEILRQYYELDKEPSDEIKTKIHIDLEINRLKEENQKLRDENFRLITICRPPVVIPQPYPYYRLGNITF